MSAPTHPPRCTTFSMGGRHTLKSCSNSPRFANGMSTIIMTRDLKATLHTCTVMDSQTCP